MKHEEKVIDLAAHKQNVANFFKGEFIDENILQVDSEVASGFILFFQESEKVNMMCFNIQLNQDVSYYINLENSSYFNRAAYFFLNNAYICNLNDNNEQQVKYNGFLTANKEIALKGKAKKGDYLRHISMYYDEHLFDEIRNEEIKSYYKSKQEFLIYMDARDELQFFRKTLWRIFEYPEEVRNKIIRIKLQELKYIFLQRLVSLDVSKLDVKASGITTYQLTQLFMIRDRILNNLKEKPSVAELVTETGIHKTLLQNLFQETFGYTIYNFFTVNRLEQTRVALVDKMMSTSEIAFEFGYSDVQHFSSQFKKMYGTSPSAYYKQFNDPSE
ncbi:AraC family transcriptional regulator [Flammeovirga sp. SubArs3]|uniref:helix-turn-helix domain-containing protein n=1 Tax=Flammeovirga sp. SubArs3 TaxID=2995316 RepID=UPI00248B39EC|nr:AraC family transcriptional regulator [Flammeovirga sp. SubArs3]